MKTVQKFIALLSVSALLVALPACRGTGDDSNKPSDGNVDYKDTIERPEIEMPEIAEQVVYPAKPATAPSAPEAGKAPSISAYTPSETKSTYTLAEKDGVTSVTYNGVSDWSYVYAQVQNYSAEYGNIKITLNNGTPAAERIAIQAVYYEAYELGYAPVTVELVDLAEGEQYVIAELGKINIKNNVYQEVQNTPLGGKTIIGFVIFIDSLPTFAPTSNTGAIDIVNFEFLKDGDPALEDRYVKPIITMTGESAEVSGDGLLLPVEKYSADYTKYTLELNGAEGGQVELAVQYTLGKQTAISAPKTVTLTGEAQTVEYDFTDVRPTTGGNDMTTQFVKNGTVKAISVKPVGSATATVSNPAFVRTATETAYVSDAWTSAASSVAITRAANGGNAKIEYSFYDSWANFSVPVRKGTGVTGMKLTIYAPDGLDHLGIGITNNSMLSSGGQNVGSFILRGASALFKGTETESFGTMNNDGEPNLKGLKETVAYNEATKTYTLTYDFSGMPETSKFENYTMTSLLFYLNCPDGVEDHYFDGTHTLYFLSIDLLTK
ncbi:MAG: hypothetical protein K2N84_02045 [Clostridia bacterium]|nr:hypothetical protein [Clostridia bacterium]